MTIQSTSLFSIKSIIFRFQLIWKLFCNTETTTAPLSEVSLINHILKSWSDFIQLIVIVYGNTSYFYLFSRYAISFFSDGVRLCLN